MMEKDITSGMMINRKILAYDSISSKSGFEDIWLEPIIKHLLNRGSQEFSELKVVHGRIKGSLEEFEFIC